MPGCVPVCTMYPATFVSGLAFHATVTGCAAATVATAVNAATDNTPARAHFRTWDSNVGIAPLGIPREGQRPCPRSHDLAGGAEDAAAPAVSRGDPDDGAPNVST